MTTSPTFYLLPLVDPASIQDLEEQATIPDLNAKIDVINNCLTHISIRMQDLTAFIFHLNDQPLEKEWVYLHSDYIDLQKEIKYITETAKPIALKLIGQLPTNSKGCSGKMAMGIFDKAINELQRKNLEALKNINEWVYDNKIQFPIPPPVPSEGLIEDCASATVKNRGPIITVVAATIALTTLTPLGTILGPYIATIPRMAGSFCADIGETIGNLFAFGIKPEYISSKTAKTAGQIACCVACIYPAFSYFNKPLSKFLKSAHHQCNKALERSSNYPKTTGFCASGASWFLLHYTGVAQKTSPYVHPMITSGLMGLGATYAVDYMKPIVNDLVIEDPMSLPIPARLIPDQYPIDAPNVLAPRRPIASLVQAVRPTPVSLTLPPTLVTPSQTPAQSIVPGHQEQFASQAEQLRENFQRRQLEREASQLG